MYAYLFPQYKIWRDREGNWVLSIRRGNRDRWAAYYRSPYADRFLDFIGVY